MSSYYDSYYDDASGFEQFQSSYFDEPASYYETSNYDEPRPKTSSTYSEGYVDGYYDGFKDEIVKSSNTSNYSGYSNFATESYEGFTPTFKEKIANSPVAYGAMVGLAGLAVGSGIAYLVTKDMKCPSSVTRKSEFYAPRKSSSKKRRTTTTKKRRARKSRR